MKKRVNRDALFVKFLGASFIILVLLTVFIPGFFYFAWKDKDDHGSTIPAESRVYISSYDIYIKKEVEYGTYSLILYLTNHYDTAVENIHVDLLLLKQDAIIVETTLKIAKIDAVNSIEGKFSNIGLTDGHYTAVFKLWQKGAVTGSTDITFTIDEGEVNDFKRGPDKIDPEIVFQEEINMEAEENPFDRFIWVAVVLTCTLLAASVLVIVVLIYYHKQTKDGEEND